MSIVIFDTEYTSWKGCQENGWKNGQEREVVQLSAVKIDENLQVIDELCCYVKPKINPVLSDYFSELTGITNETIQKKGEDFASVYEKFYDFVAGDVCWSHGWGSPENDECDGTIINHNLELLNLPKKTVKYKNIGAFFAKIYKKYGIDVKSQASGMIAKILKRENNLKTLNLNEHNALYDVYSILEGVRYFAEEAEYLFRK